MLVVQERQNTENIRNLHPFTNLLTCLGYLLCGGDCYTPGIQS